MERVKDNRDIVQNAEPVAPARMVAPGFGAYLRNLRVERSLSLREAAMALKISFTYLQKLEAGTRTTIPSVLMLQQMAAAYDVPTTQVFAAAGLQVSTIENHAAAIDRVFRRLVLHPRLMPEGMDAKYWIDSFSTRQKRQIIELVQRLEQFLEDPNEPERQDVMSLLHGIPPED